MSDTVTPWTVACQAPQFMGFSRQEHWSGLPCPPPGDLPNPGIEPGSPESGVLTGGLFTAEPPGKPLGKLGICSNNYKVVILHCNRASLLSTIDIWGQKILWNVLQDVSSPTNLYPWDASSNPPPTGCDNQACLQTWPEVSCLAKSHPSIENHCIRNMKAMSKYRKVSKKLEQCDKEFRPDSWVYSYHLTKKYNDLSDLIMHLIICHFKK